MYNNGNIQVQVQLHRIGNTYNLFYKESEKLPSLDDIVEIQSIDKAGKVNGLVVTKVKKIKKHELSVPNVTMINNKGFIDDIEKSDMTKELGYLVSTVCINIFSYSGDDSNSSLLN